LQEEIELQKKSQGEQQKAQEEFSKAYDVQREAMEEAMKEVRKQGDAASKYKDMVKIYRGGGDFPRFEFNHEPFLWTQGDAFLVHSFGDEERTSWDLSKSLKENSYSGDYSFDVDRTAKNVVMAVNGDCKAGNIRIKIILPNGKTYSDVVIDEFGNLNWRKSFTISGEENKDKTGEWKFKIDADKATGFFRISLQTY